MRKGLLTTPDDPVLTILRLLLGIVYFPHGAQKLLGWFGGGGFHGTMMFLTKGEGAPTFLAFMVILVEFFGPIGLFLGFLSRIAALGIGIDMLGAVLLVHIHVGFFMNWSGQQKGEGFEFHLLVFAIVIALVVKGSGSFLDRPLALEKYR